MDLMDAIVGIGLVSFYEYKGALRKSVTVAIYTGQRKAI
jgi:hypothetical protein